MTRFTETRILKCKYRSILGHGEDSMTDIYIDLDHVRIERANESGE